MLQDKQPDSLSHLNPKDVAFARHQQLNISEEWYNKFLKGAHEHGGINKPSFLERRGLIREALNEHYDGISYVKAIDYRLQEAKMLLGYLLSNPNANFSMEQVNTINKVIELLS